MFRMLILAVLVFGLVACEQAPPLETHDFAQSSAFTWRPDGASYVFECVFDEAPLSLSCIAKSQP